MDVALVGRALAHEGHRDLSGLPDLGRQCDADRVQDLRGHRRAHRQQVVCCVPVVPRHLASAGRRIVGRRVLGRHHVPRGHSEGHRGGDRAVERCDPIVALLEGPGNSHLGTFVTLAADNERDPTGAVQNPHPLVDRARERDHPIHLDQLLVGQPDRRSHAPDDLGGPPSHLTSLRDGHLPIAAAQKLIERPSTASAASPSTSASVGWG